MSQRHLASVLFAVLGVFIAVTGLGQLILGLLVQVNGTNMADHNAKAVVITLLIGMSVAILLGVSLVLARDVLARRLFPVDSQPLVARDTQAVALSVLGCYFVIQGAAQLISRVVSFHEINWSAIVQVALGLGLFVGARGIARFWTFARTAGSGAGERAV